MPYKMMYTYEEITDKIENSRRFGTLSGVEISRIMLEKLGHPQKELPFIHVAGTNGKGSVCAFLNSVFMKAGLRCGCFTSPHLVDFGERITVDGKMIEQSAVTRIGNELLNRDWGVMPSMFDYCLMMAVLYFKEKQCDIAIIETGLGGRLDSTNALGAPVLSVITRIGYDHMAVLGGTLTEIAAEKAGILKPGVKAVFAPQEPEVLEVLIKAQRECNLVSGKTEQSTFKSASRSALRRQHPLQGVTYNEQCSADCILVTPEDIQRAKRMQPGLRGVYQYENAAAAMLAAEEYFKMNLPAPSRGGTEGVMPGAGYMQVISDGICSAYWPGRMEILSEHPFLLVDGAHNSNGVLALKESLQELYGGEKFHFIMGVMADKDYEQMVEPLLSCALDFVTVTPESSRALQAETLAECIRAHKIPAKSIPSVYEVRRLLEERMDRNEKTVAFGSLYFIGELKKIW